MFEVLKVENVQKTSSAYFHLIISVIQPAVFVKYCPNLKNHI